MKINIGKWGKIGSLLFLVIIIFLSIQNGKNIHTHLLKNKVVIVGYMTEKIPNNPKSPGGISFMFRYEYKGKVYEMYSSSYAFANNTDYSNRLVKKFYPVVLDSTNPNNSDILLNREKFTEYDVPFPDSLEWANQLLR